MANIIQINGKKVKDVNAARMSSLAPVESSTTASMAHAVGDYFWLNGTLYEATAAITVGNAISVGTNCKITNMGENLADLKSQINVLGGYFEKGINLFNPNDPDLVENVELKNTGATVEKTGYFASGYIPVVPGGTLCCHYPTGVYGTSSVMVTYNADKERVSYYTTEQLTDSNGRQYIRKTFPADATAAYVRMTGSMAGTDIWYMYVYADEMPSVYMPYTDKVKLSDDVVVPFANVVDVAISKSDVDFITPAASNLVDLTQMIPGIITSSSSNGNVDTSGNYGTNWKTTDYIEVEPGETYALCIFPGVNYGTSFAGIPCYDKNKNFLVRVKQAGGSIAGIASRVTITIPTNTAVPIKYIRTSYYTSYAQNPKRWWQCQIFHATTWPGDLYVPFDDGEQIDAVRLDNTVSGAYNSLFSKSAIWNGDSICAADNDSEYGGWPGRIAMVNRMRFKNYAIAGGTIAENTGTGVHSVSGTLDTMISEFPDAEYIIIEGGTNDADILGADGIGTFDADDFSAEYIAALDKDTFSGALESIFYRLVTQMKGKHIGYLIPQKMGHTEVLVTRRRAYFDRAIDICKKWGIPCLDLWNGLYFNWRLAAHWDQSMTSAENEAAGNLYMDGQHLTTTGYAIQSPIIAEWIKTI